MNLYPFQQQTIDKLSQSKRPVRHILAFSTGLGKSLSSLLTCKALSVNRLLIICPAVTRIGWKHEIDKWWPERAQDIGIVFAGRKRSLSSVKQEALSQAYNAPIQILSYALVKEVAAKGWDAIILDEIHYLKSPTSQQSKFIKLLVKANPQAHVLGLSATPMPDNVQDLWNPLDTLFPKQWGKPNANGKYSYEFNNRYMHKQETPYGLKWSGVKNANELQERLSAVMTRVTKHEVAHLLPKYQVRKLSIEGSLDVPANVTLTQRVMEALLCKAADKKSKEVPMWADDAWAEGCTHLLIFTYRKNLARTLLADTRRRVKDEYFGATITGDDSIEERNQIIGAWAKAPRGLIIATMDSCGTGVNGLEKAQRMLFAELHYRPEKLVQAMGRGNRLSSAAGCNIDILVLSNTLDERVADAVLQKITAINQVLRADIGEEELEEKLGHMDEDTFTKELERLAYEHSTLKQI